MREFFCLLVVFCFLSCGLKAWSDEGDLELFMSYYHGPCSQWGTSDNCFYKGKFYGTVGYSYSWGMVLVWDESHSCLNQWYVGGGADGIRIFNDKVYVSCRGRMYIEVYDLDGNFLYDFGGVGLGGGLLYFPGLIEIYNNQVWVVNGIGGFVSVFDLSGNWIKDYWGVDSGWGYGVSVDDTGFYTMWALNGHWSYIQKFDFNGNLIWRTADGIMQTYAVCVRVTGNQVLACDSGNSRIAEFDLNGNFLGSFGSYGTGPGEFRTPNDVDVYLDGGSYHILSNDSAYWNENVFARGPLGPPPGPSYDVGFVSGLGGLVAGGLFDLIILSFFRGAKEASTG